MYREDRKYVVMKAAEGCVFCFVIDIVSGGDRLLFALFMSRRKLLDVI